ncbi:hypothetical protein HPO96_12500 [Kribbella sandramycini]|uniref:Uncharacterized protein n=1 Tax=Kribbella sandramycini TaxID=60450 RepID=A0A7Y4KYL6_9ACTN|nr:hypothetical protein [Kribbella sandramycini]MBB6569093.1 hypothetical protein [Kribbella sandramycini]NOL41064.1 hypothetical protein [Kribbella sandramycini]
MRNRVGRGLIALGTVLTLLIFPGATAMAEDGQTVQQGTRSCSMYVNSIGFGAYCSNGQVTYGSGAPIPTWRERLGNNVFIPCRDMEVPKGIDLPKAPAGKHWVLRLTIVDFDLDSKDGGKHVHIERAIVPVGEEEEDQCPATGYMSEFWDEFHNQYPAPILQVKPTYTPRVNVPAYFSLTPDSSYILYNQSNPETAQDLYWGGSHDLVMRGLVGKMVVDPGDGTPPFTCPMGVVPAGDTDGYDETSDPFTQMSTCKHVYKRSSANQPDKMYTVKLTITWDVSYWIGPPDWNPLGSAEVHAVQRLPVQEVQAIGG